MKLIEEMSLIGNSPTSPESTTINQTHIKVIGAFQASLYTHIHKRGIHKHVKESSMLKHLSMQEYTHAHTHTHT